MRRRLTMAPIAVAAVSILSTIGTSHASPRMSGADGSVPDPPPITGAQPTAIENLPPPSLERNEEQVRQFASTWNISITEAIERLTWQQQLPGFDLDTSNTLGDAFGGIWIDNENGNRVTVGVVGDAATLAAVIQPLADRWKIAPDGLSVVQVRYSYAELKRQSEWLADQFFSILPTPERPMEVGLDVPANRVHIRFEDQNLTRSEEIFLDAVQPILGEMLIIDYGAVAVVPAACAFPYCDPPLRGGVAIDGGVLCTAGFMGQSNTVFTAGHCVESGGSAVWRSQDASGAYSDIGYGLSNYNHQPADYGLIDVDNSSYWGSEGTIWVSANHDNPIYNRSTSHVGDNLCVTGRNTGTLCGTVVAVAQNFGCTNPSIPSTCNYRDFGRMNTCQVPGDSGGPVVHLNTARGLVGTVASPQSSPCLMYFQGIKAAVVGLGTELVYESP